MTLLFSLNIMYITGGADGEIIRLKTNTNIGNKHKEIFVTSEDSIL